MKGLIVKKEPAIAILNGMKTVEVRGVRTLHRGRIGIVISKTKKVWGSVEVYDCIPLTKELFEDIYKERHRSRKSYEELLRVYQKPYAWLLRNAKKFDVPIDYNHKQGCVTWVNIGEELLKNI